MSKSLGNFLTIREALKDWPGEVVRFNMLKAHYRQPIDWTLSSLNESQRELDKCYPLAKQFAVSEATLAPEFLAALEDDLNTPEAITVLRRLYREAQEGDVSLAGTRFASCGHFIGLFQSELCRLESGADPLRQEPCRKPDRGAARRAPGEGLDRIRPPPRRIDRPRHRAQGQ